MSPTPEPGNEADPIALFLHRLLERIVDRPEAVSVRALAGHPTLYEVSVAPEDVGQVIGREGRIVKSIRSLVGAAALKRGERATVEIVERT